MPAGIPIGVLEEKLPEKLFGTPLIKPPWTPGGKPLEGKDIGGPIIIPPGTLIDGGRVTGGPEIVIPWEFTGKLIGGSPELIEIGGRVVIFCPIGICPWANPASTCGGVFAVSIGPV